MQLTIRREVLRDVALLGGDPAFNSTLVVGRPNMPDRNAFLARIGSMLDSKQFTNLGPMVRELETRVAQDMGARHCIAVCNGTVGLELMIEALGLTGEVIVPSFTFIATVHALHRLGLKPVFCDVDPKTHCLDPAAVERAVTPATSAILGVSLWGNYDGERALRRIADDHCLHFLLDSAHSFGCAHEDGGRKVIADGEVLSFHATKCIHAMEGGAIVVNDDALAEHLRHQVNFGFAGEDRVIVSGTNGKMNEAEAAMGLTSLDAQDRIFAHNRRNLETYAEGLAELPGISIMSRARNWRHNCQYVVTEIDADQIGLTRDELVSALRLENVLARRYFHPGCHRMQPYRELFPDAGGALPETEALCDRVMVLPNGLEVSPADAALLKDRIGAIISRAPEVRAALAQCDDPRLPGYASLKQE